MPSLIDRLVATMRTWSTEFEHSDYTLVYHVELMLGRRFGRAGVRADLDTLTPLEIGRLAIGEIEGHPTLEGMRLELERLTALGIWEPFLVAAVARAVADHLDDFADHDEALKRRNSLLADLQRFEDDPERRAAWVAAVRDQQIANGIPPDDYATDVDADEFVEKARRQLPKLDGAEAQRLRREASGWRRAAADLLDYRTMYKDGLTGSTN